MITDNTEKDDPKVVIIHIMHSYFILRFRGFVSCKSRKV
jgi:hypothetical protein